MVLYFLVYVDDLVLTGNNVAALSSLVCSLSSKFALKDLGDLHFFLGNEVARTSNGLFMSQCKYIQDLLMSTDMLDAKPLTTLVASGSPLSISHGVPL